MLLHIAELDTYVTSPTRARIMDAAVVVPKARAYLHPSADHAFARVNGQNWQGLAAASPTNAALG